MTVLFTGGSGVFSGVLQLIVVLIMFLFVLALAYGAARLAGRFQGNIQARSNVKVLETARIGNNKYIQIVKLGNRYFALGIGKEAISLLAELSEDELNLETANGAAKGSFRDILSQLQKKKDEKKPDES